LKKHHQTRAVLIGGLVAAATLIPAASASAGPSANAAVGFSCPKFTVVHGNTSAGFPKGVYNRLNFAPKAFLLNCDDSFQVLRSYLYAPDDHAGWKVGKLTGKLADRTGRRFIKSGSNGRIGFDVYK
jgi:hypothetical protein